VSKLEERTKNDCVILSPITSILSNLKSTGNDNKVVSLSSHISATNSKSINMFDNNISVRF